jgi:hypothetical protein
LSTPRSDLFNFHNLMPNFASGARSEILLRMPTKASAKTSAKVRTPVPESHHTDILSRVSPPHGLTWRDHVVQLLRVASSIEHALMVQYLFAAYSLKPEAGANEEERRTIADWQNLILCVAKEEMGHLLTVQNVLCLLGAPVELARDYNYGDRDFYPFAFRLEPLTMESITRYTCAEMPDEIPDTNNPFVKILEYLIDYRASIPKDPGTPHVGDLYRYIIDVIADPDLIPDCDFQEDSYRFQASWDDWGRGYNIKTAMHDSVNLATLIQFLFEKKHESTRANVIIERVATRTQVKAALVRVFEQGEAAPTSFAGSHFQRFFAIRRDFERIQCAKKEKGIDWKPTYQVVENPHTLTSNGKPGPSTITWPHAKKWADLFNLRYRMLLTYLSHSFELARDGNQASLRGAVIHKAFGEMYNLKAIAGILVRLPLKKPASKGQHFDCAGPPFQMPNTLALANDAIGRWQLHGDLIKKAIKLSHSLVKTKSGSKEEASYLRAMEELDRNSAEWIKKVIAGLKRGQAYSSS